MKNLLIFFLSLMLIASCSRSTLIKNSNGITYQTPKGLLSLTVYDNNVIHLQYTPEGHFTERKSLIVLDSTIKKTAWSVSENSDQIILSTETIQAHIDKGNGLVVFTNINGNVVLKEAGRIIKDTSVLGERCKYIQQKFNWKAEEGIYGLGQYQDGMMNYRGKIRKLVQQNTVDVVPVFVSSKGYGILWDNYSYTEFSDTAYIEGKDDVGSLSSEVGDGIDYYFIYGPELDKVIASYRNLSGHAPMYGRWAYGLWQCKEHYQTQAEILEVAKQYRSRNIPVDNIVQDWFYWSPEPIGSHHFDRPRYPDPDALTKALHEKYNMKIMISVWGKFGAGSANYNELDKAGYLYPPTHQFGEERYYDPYNPQARKMYWKQMNDSIFKRNFDAWWLDATEPEMGDLTNDTIKKAMNNYLGSGARYLNSFSLMTTKAVYEGQRNITNQKRVFILTRSNFAGQQRNAAASWSGDIRASWEVYHNQIAGGLNMGLSGLPYWTTDIGAFFVDDFPGGNQNKEYQELFVRWFQFGAFCPIFRVHGTSTPREMYKFGDKGYWAYDAQLKADQLRYRLMPYIYSLAWKVHQQGYTIMRGLEFDFRDDPKVKNINDQFMFGPSILVNPVTEVMYHKDFLNIQNISEVIPSANFICSSGQRKGLSGEYFNDENFTKKVLSRVDSTINFDWHEGSPDKKINCDHFSVRWTGQIIADQTGDYIFVTSSDDGIRLKIDNKLIIDDWKQQSVTYFQAKVKLQAGEKYNIQLEYYDVIGGASVKLAWIKPGKMKEIDYLQKHFTKDGMVKTRKVYLPICQGWYDFWTGHKIKSGQVINAPAPIDNIPLYVKAGSIITMGPLMNYTTEKPTDPIEIRIYPGANAQSIIYEDENDNYNYESGQYDIIPLKWDESKNTLTIDTRIGFFPGMINERTFNLVIVSPEKGIGEAMTKKIDKAVKYSGSAINIELK